MKKLARVGAFFCMVAAWPLLAQAPVFDTSGNGMLTGTYYFRHVIYLINQNADSSGVTGDVQEAVAVYGKITFDGNGAYTINSGTVSDSYVGAIDPLSCYLAGVFCSTGSAVRGTYSMSANGYGFIQNLITGDNVYGLLSSNGVFAGSSTETTIAYNDLFIAAPVPSPVPTNSFFKGSYSVAGIFPSPASALYSTDAFFQVNPDGNGNLGTVNVTGYYANGGASTISQSSANVKYFFSNGAAVVTFPASTTADFFPGGSANPEWLYFSPDGNFFFGGSPTGGFDMIVGVRNSGTQNFGNLYYAAGLYQDASQLGANGVVDFDGYYGSFNASSGGTIYAHERLDSLFYGVYNYTFADSFSPPVSATYTDTAFSEQYAVGAGGAIRIGQGIWPYIGIDVAIQQPPPGGAGVYLYPTGIENVASYAPFTAGVSNGEALALFGTNLAPGSASAPGFPLPTNLAGVQVMVNGIPAPILNVSPGQVNIVTPYENPFNLAQFQVVNNGIASNVVTEPVYATTPGVFTADGSGAGDGALLHGLTGDPVTESNPAQPGEAVEVLMSGLGAVYPPVVSDGSAAPSNPPSLVYPAQITAYVGGAQATVNFAELAPGFAGLYQVEVVIPSNAVAGDNALDISGTVPIDAAGDLAVDSYNSQALIPIGSGPSASARKPATRVRGRLRAESVKPRAKPCLLFGARTGCKAKDR